ncbi:MAG: c-type cytochrome, partial [Chloroflexi bacterium]|nr:c-type cytochrome [Chloroflexota bacterium]
ENCVTCHGAQGRGDGPAAATLAIQPADLKQHAFHHDETYLTALLTRGGATMPAFGTQLSRAQMTDVIAYIRLLARGE